MAGAGYKLFNTGDVLTAAQVNTYLQEQAVMRFANAAARTTALSSVLAEGMVSYLQDTDAVEVYNGTSWVGVATGDITGITTGATSGLTGGVTSGTADLKLNTTAKGGLLVGTGSGTVTELAVGTNAHVLTADSTTASGLKWAAASSTPSFVGCSVYRTSTLNVSNNTNTAVPFDSESFDTDGFHSTSSNTSRITIPSGKAGKYLFNCTTNFEGAPNGHRQGNLYKNGSIVKALAQFATITTGSPTASGSTIVDAAVGDYFELVVFQNNGTGLFLDGNINNTTFSCQYLGA